MRSHIQNCQLKSNLDISERICATTGALQAFNHLSLFNRRIYAKAKHLIMPDKVYIVCSARCLIQFLEARPRALPYGTRIRIEPEITHTPMAWNVFDSVDQKWKRDCAYRQADRYLKRAPHWLAASEGRVVNRAGRTFVKVTLRTIVCRGR